MADLMRDRAGGGSDRSLASDAWLNASLVLASDIHLQHMGDSRAQLLLNLLGRLGPRVEVFVLNGDIFDFCFGGGEYYRRKFKALGDALTAVADRGVRVLFIEGNHEVHMDHIGWRGVEVYQGREYALTLKDGTRLKISHGDRLTGERAYAVFRWLCKLQLARCLAALIPGSWFDAYSLTHAKYSRSQDQYRELNHGRILAAFERWLEGDPASSDNPSPPPGSAFDHGIIGHFHVPYAEPRQGKAGLMLSVDSWDKPNVLVYSGGAFGRVYLTEPGGPLAVEPVTPVVTAAPAAAR